MPSQTLVHVHQDAAELGRVYRPQLGIVSSLPEFAAAARALEPLDGGRWADWSAAARADYEATLRYDPAPGNGVDLAAVVEHLRERLPDAIVANGAGNYTVWVHRFWQFSRYRSQLAPLSGAMGYGVPAAVAGKLVHPERPVVAFAGDGCFLMCAQELATMVANDLADPRDRRQQRHARRRSACTRSATTRAASWRPTSSIPTSPRSRAASAPSASGSRRRRRSPAALERALAAGGPALLELVCDPEALTPRQSLSRGARSGRAQQRGELTLVVAAAALADGRRQRPLELLAREVARVEHLAELDDAHRRARGRLVAHGVAAPAPAPVSITRQ